MVGIMINQFGDSFYFVRVQIWFNCYRLRVTVASKFLKDGEWGKPLYIAEYRSDLHPGIRASFESLKNYEEFIKTLIFVF